jgi:hypothetical protein
MKIEFALLVKQVVKLVFIYIIPAQILIYPTVVVQLVFHLYNPGSNNFSDMSAFTPTPTSPLRVMSGRAAIFDFPPISSVPSPAVSWQADDGSALHGQKYEVTIDHRLVILSVESGDGKKYRWAGSMTCDFLS